MKLQDFVSETLKEIIDGVVTAQNYAKEKKALINPTDISTWGTGKGDRLYHPNTSSFVYEINFDVAVTTVEEKGTKGGIGIFVGSLGVGAQGKSDTINSSVSRIQFLVPIVFPSQS
jgi:hypothetical protein